MIKNMKNEYCITWNLYKSWVTANMFKGKSLFFRIFWCLLLVLMIVFGIISLNIGDVKAISIYFFLLSLLCLYNAFLRHIILAKKTYRKLSETYGKENWTRTILFENDNILLTDNNVSIKYKYSDIVDIKENGNEVNRIYKNKKTTYEIIYILDNNEIKTKYLIIKDTTAPKIDIDLRNYDYDSNTNTITLKKYDKSELFTITGINYYKNDVQFNPGLPLKLVKEPDNEFDNDSRLEARNVVYRPRQYSLTRYASQDARVQEYHHG